ncbi:MAG TPA: hypothetical protein VGM51_13025 [Armatimonadota bacterium]|jgi:hypothetical protein
MVYNYKQGWGERNLRGQGPTGIKMYGGGGRSPMYDEGAADYNVYPSMTSITRLRMMSYLCLHGPIRIPALARKLDVPEITVRQGMWALKSTWAVEGNPSVIGRGYSRSRTGGCYSMEWDATETGRKWLWRYGWVTRRIGPDFQWYWPGWGFDLRWDLAPYDVLRDYAEPTLLRPAAMAIARFLMYENPTQGPKIAEMLGFNRCMVEQYLKRWYARGWIDHLDGELCVRSYWAPDCVVAAPRWTLTRYGEAAMYRHADALRWASQTCGYTPPEDDDFLNDRDMVNYLPAVFYYAEQ